MKLVYRLALTFIIPLMLTLGLWGWLSYRTMERKINKDTDIILKNYSDDVISRMLAGKQLPEKFNGAYNTYYIREVTEEYAMQHPWVSYHEDEVYIAEDEDFASSRVRRQIFCDSDGRWHEIVASVPTFEEDVLIEHILVWTIVLFVVLMLALLVIGILVIRYNMKPFFILLKWIEGYNPGEVSSPVPDCSDILEFRKLSQAVSNAVERFEREYEDKRIFIGNASHELQTPLSVCSNRLELLLCREDLDHDTAQELVKVNHSLQHLIRLNRTMLMLTKVENRFYQHDMEDVDIKGLVESSLELAEEIYSYKGITSAFVDEGSFICRINPQMASVLVDNLVRNAFIHNQTEGEVRIHVCKDSLSVSNTGTMPLDRDGLFSRFYQPGGRKEGNTGLGLSLVNAICGQNGLSVDYDFSDSMHIFRVVRSGE